MLVRVLAWGFAIIITLMGILWLFSPQLISLVMNKQLAHYQLETSEEAHLRFNPFLLALTIENLEINHQDTTKVFNLKSGYIQVSLSQLFRQAIHFKHFELDGVYLPVTKAQESWVLLGQVLTPSVSNNKSDSNTEPSPWQVSAETISLNNSRVIVNANRTHTLNVDSVIVEKLSYAANDQRLSLNFEGEISEAPVKLNSYIDLLAQSYSGQLTVSNFKIENLTQWLPKEYAQVQAQTGLSTKFSITLQDTLNVALNKTHLNIQALVLPNIEQRLSVDVSDIDVVVDKLIVNGRNVSSSNTALTINGISVVESEQSLTAQIDGFQVNANDLGIKDSQIFIDESETVLTNLKVTSTPLKLGAKLAHAEWRLSSLIYGEQIASVNQSDFSITEFEAISDGYALNASLNGAQWLLPELSFENGELSAITSTTANQLNILSSDTQATVLKVESFSAPNIKINGGKDRIESSAENLAFNQIEASQINNDIKPIAEIKGVTLDNFSVSHTLESNATHLSIEHIDASKINSYLLFENQVLKNLVTVNANDTNSEVKSVKGDTAQPEELAASKFTYAIDRITTQGQINIEDNDAVPSFNATVDLTQLRVESLDNSESKKVTSYMLEGKTGRHANFSLSGDYQAFNPQTNLSLVGDIHELALPKIVGYFAKGAQVNILSGQLDSKLDVHVVDDQISGSSELFVRGLELAKEASEQGSVQQDNSVISLNTALNMLQDSKGNLELDVPLSGDVSSPEFGLQSFVGIITQKAVMVAAESYLMQTVVPYGNILSLAKIAGEMVLKIRLEDLVYEPQQIDLGEQQKPFANNLIKLMTDKEDLQFKVCAIATIDDLTPDHGLDEKAQSTYLHKLSERRGQAFKDYLIQHGSISSKRLLLCHGQVEKTAEKPPRIVFDS